MSLRLAWTVYKIPGQPGVHIQTLTQKKGGWGGERKSMKTGDVGQGSPALPSRHKVLGSNPPPPQVAVEVLQISLVTHMNLSVSMSECVVLYGYIT